MGRLPRARPAADPLAGPLAAAGRLAQRLRPRGRARRRLRLRQRRAALKSASRGELVEKPQPERCAPKGRAGAARAKADDRTMQGADGNRAEPRLSKTLPY